MVVIRDGFRSLKKNQEGTWEERLLKTGDSTIVIFWESTSIKDVEKHPLYKIISEKSGVYTYVFPLLQHKELISWISKCVQKYGSTIEVKAQELLALKTGSDLWQLNGEIQKLVGYADGKNISRFMVETLVHAQFSDQIFAFLDAVSQQRIIDAMQLLEEERLSGASDGYLFNMLTRQVRILLELKACLEEHPTLSKDKAASLLNLHPFVVSKTISQVKAFPLEHLKKTHDYFYELDRGMKTGRYSERMGMDLAIVALLQP